MKLVATLALLAAMTTAARAEEKEPYVAGGLAIASPIVGALMISETVTDAEGNAAVAWAGLGVLALGPSLGHLYAGEYGHAGIATLVRGACIGLLAYSFSGPPDTYEGHFPTHHEDGYEKQRALAGISGAVIFASSALYDMYDAPRAARRANEKQVSIAPTPMGNGYGVTVGGSF